MFLMSMCVEPIWVGVNNTTTMYHSFCIITLFSGPVGRYVRRVNPVLFFVSALDMRKDTTLNNLAWRFLPCINCGQCEFSPGWPWDFCFAARWKNGKYSGLIKFRKWNKKWIALDWSGWVDWIRYSYPAWIRLENHGTAGIHIRRLKLTFD